MNYGKNDNLNSNNDWYWCQTYYVMYFTYPLYPLAWSSQHSSEGGTFIIPSLYRWEHWDVEVMRIAQGHEAIKERTGIHIPSAKLQNQSSTHFPMLTSQTTSMTSQQRARRAFVLVISYSNSSPMFWTQTHYFRKTSCSPVCVILKPTPFLYATCSSSLGIS